MKFQSPLAMVAIPLATFSHCRSVSCKPNVPGMTWLVMAETMAVFITNPKMLTIKNKLNFFKLSPRLKSRKVQCLLSKKVTTTAEPNETAFSGIIPIPLVIPNTHDNKLRIPKSIRMPKAPTIANRINCLRISTVLFKSPRARFRRSGFRSSACCWLRSFLF